MLPEERAREKIDRQLKKAGWDIVSREEYIRNVIIPLPPLAEQCRIVARLEELLAVCEKE